MSSYTREVHADSLPIFSSADGRYATWRFEVNGYLIDLNCDNAKAMRQKWTASRMIDAPEMDRLPMDLKEAVEAVATVTRGDLYDTHSRMFLGVFIPAA